MSKQLEETILGTALMYNSANFDLMENIPTAEIFTSEVNRAYFAALRETFEKGLAHEMVLITKLAEKYADGIEPNEITSAAITLMTASTVPAAVNSLCRSLLDDYVKRSMSVAGLKISSASHDSKISGIEALEMGTNELRIIEDIASGEKPETLKTQIADTISGLRLASENKGLIGKETGLSELDKITGGWQDGNLIVIAGRPAMGKSALALKTIVHNCKRGIPCLLFSREMTSQEVVKRINPIMGGSFEMNRLFTYGLSKEEVKRFELEMKPVDEWPLIIDEQSNNINQVLFQIKRFARKNPNGIVIIDYVQLLNGFVDKKGQNDTSVLTDITRSLKQVAKQTSLPVIILSQLSREVEKQPNKLPLLSNLKQSGSIEEDANLVIFCYRPEYYDLETFPDDSGTDARGLADLIIAKNRNGGTGYCRIGWEGAKVLFYDLEPRAFKAEDLKSFIEPDGDSSDVF